MFKEGFCSAVSWYLICYDPTYARIRQPHAPTKVSCCAPELHWDAASYSAAKSSYRLSTAQPEKYSPLKLPSYYSQITNKALNVSSKKMCTSQDTLDCCQVFLNCSELLAILRQGIGRDPSRSFLQLAPPLLVRHGLPQTPVQKVACPEGCKAHTERVRPAPLL